MLPDEIFTGDLAPCISLIVYVREKPTNAIIIHSAY
jgi:hypothetical protein